MKHLKIIITEFLFFRQNTILLLDFRSGICVFLMIIFLLLLHHPFYPVSIIHVVLSPSSMLFCLLHPCYPVFIIHIILSSSSMLFCLHHPCYPVSFIYVILSPSSILSSLQYHLFLRFIYFCFLTVALLCCIFHRCFLTMMFSMLPNKCLLAMTSESFILKGVLKRT